MTVQTLEETQTATSDQAESSETPTDGNVSMAEFADQLLKRKEAKEAEPEVTTEETDEPSTKLKSLRKSPRKLPLKIRKTIRRLHNLRRMFFPKSTISTWTTCLARK